MATFTRDRGPLGALAAPPVTMLVCFAVREEAKFFLPPEDGDGAVQVWLTGMGRQNAAESIRAAIQHTQPQRVLSCGFAGGLNPRFKVGDLLYDCDFDVGLAAELEELQAVPATFYCAKRVAITAEEKRQLWESTAADAVEMESSVIRTICQEFKIPSATIRVISDAANENLPLDFNALMTGESRIDYVKLARTILLSPGKIPKLIKFQQQTAAAARNMGRLLEGLIGKACR
ncbi:MAG TPA: hypothetical protein VL527_19600 [Dongiaceae bacterium]|nr:hypothetical protein [Dongiaceae bacterium]